MKKDAKLVEEIFLLLRTPLSHGRDSWSHDTETSKCHSSRCGDNRVGVPDLAAAAMPIAFDARGSSSSRNISKW